MTALAPEQALRTAPSTRPAARPPSLRLTRDAFRLGLEYDRGFIAAIEGHDIARFRLGTRRFVSLAHPDYVDHVLHGAQPKYGRSFEYEVMKAAAGINLLTDEGDSHRRHRSLLTPMFAKRRLDGLVAQMTEPIGEVAAAIDHSNQFDMSELMVDATLEVLGRAMFGRSFADLIRESAGHVSEGMRKLEELEHLLLLVTPSQLLWKPFERLVAGPVPAPPPVRRLQQVVRVMDETIWGIVNDRRANPTDTTDLLNLLLAIEDDDGTPLPLRRVRDESFAFFVAGHETTANALSWMWWQLAQHPEHYDRLLAEVDEVLGGRTPTVADLPNLPWTQACFEESMRRYPPVWILPRQAREDDVIGGHHIAAGTNILLPIRHIHHDPRWWPEPERYDPARFLPGTAPDRPRSAYLPFGGGRRICIGRSFALMEAVLITAMLSQRYRFSLLRDGEKIRPETTFTLRPRGGLPMIATPRLKAVS